MKYLLLYLPFLASWAFQNSPETSYWIAWSGSWFLLWLTLSGRLIPLPEQKPWYQQLLRPLFLPQIIFTGYLALSSVFYFLWITGVIFKDTQAFFNLADAIQNSSLAQRFYLLGHSALVHALAWKMHYQKPQTSVVMINPTNTLLQTTILFMLLRIGFEQVPPLSQFTVKFDALGFVSATLLLAFSISERNIIILLLAGGIFFYNLYQAFLSGWKEAVLIPVILLGAYLFPRYKKLMIAMAIPSIFLAVFVLPVFVETIRQLSWRGGLEAEKAATIAYHSITTADTKTLQKSNQTFLIFRISEISMFNKYLSQVPAHRNFYDSKIVKQGLLNIIPRFFYPDKPETEKLVMERVYENGIIEYYSTSVSAKPQLAIDGYLSYGAVGVWAFCFIMGWASAIASVTAERLFGGYIWGTCVIYTGLFQEFWRGNCFEFLLNTTVWSFILMYLIYFAGRAFNIIVPVKP